MRLSRTRLVLAGGAVAAMAVATQAAHAGPTAVIHVPSGFDHSLSDTRSSGHYEVQGSSLHVYTTDNGSQAKVAEYVDTNTPLANVGEPSLDTTTHSGTILPGMQLVVDFDGNGTADGILVGEPNVYGNDWWASNSSAAFVKAGAPSTSGGSGSGFHGTLDQWRANFPGANVVAFGFSLGSGVLGDYNINDINFAGTTYTFAADVILTSKDQCKNGGWATSTNPVYTNQGECVSHFAAGK